MLASIIDNGGDIVPNIVRQVSDSESEDKSDENSAKNDGYTTLTTRIAHSVNYDTASEVVQDSKIQQ